MIPADAPDPRTTLTLRDGDDAREGGRAQLLVIAGEASWKFLLPRDGMVLVGRSLDADLRIDLASVSRRHMRFVATEGEIQVADLDSHNGVRVNGERIEGARTLAAGDLVAVGEAIFVLQREWTTCQCLPLDFERLRQALTKEIERALDCGRPLAVVALPFGEANRAAVAAAVAGELRRMDVVGWGGATQLIVILPELDARAARQLAAELLEALAEIAPAARAGFSCLPDDGCNTDTLLCAARAAAEVAPPGGVAAAAEATIRVTLGDRTVLLADPAMIKLYDLIGRLARSDLPVLVLGETGTGKENAAAAVHELSPRAAGPLIPVNCAAIPETLIESELFGYERGAFSGAAAAKPGLLERASGGTVFFDEIGELPLGAQAKLLRAVESKSITRLGDVRERKVDVRLVAATNRDLEAECRAGRFREDLLFRLSAATVSLPPLRQRLREIPVLARALLEEACARVGRPRAALSDAVLARLAAYRWQGNVRELRNAMEYAAATMTGEVVELWDLPPRVAGHAKEEGEARTPEPAKPIDATRDHHFRPIAEEIRELEIARMKEALAAAGGVQIKGAELIGMPIRTFGFKARQYGLQARDRRRG